MHIKFNAGPCCYYAVLFFLLATVNCRWICSSPIIDSGWVSIYRKRLADGQSVVMPYGRLGWCWRRGRGHGSCRKILKCEFRITNKGNGDSGLYFRHTAKG